MFARARRLRRRVNRRFYRCLFRLYRSLFPTPHWTGPLDPRSIKRVLVIRDDRVGDMVLTTPLISFLRDVAPQAEIDVLASRANAAILDHHPHVSRVFVNDRTWRSWARILPRVRTRRHDVVFNPITRHPFRQGVLVSLLSHRHAFKVSGWRPVRYQGLFTKVFRVPPRMAHMAESILAVGQLAFGRRDMLGRDGLDRYPLQLASNPESDARIATFLAAHRLERLVVVNVSAATDPEREWPPEQAAAVVSRLLERHEGLSIVITPAPAKEDRAAAVARRCAGRRVLLAPVFPLLDLVALVRRAFVVLSPSTALVHLASATGRPVVALYAPQHPNDVSLWLPVGVPYRAVVSALGGVMGDLPPDRIADAFDDLMRELERPAPEARPEDAAAARSLP